MFALIMKPAKGESIRLYIEQNTQIILISFLFLISIALRMNVLLFISIYWASIIIRQTLRKRAITRVQSLLCGYDWKRNHEIVREALEYLKYCRMVLRGYHSKSNTNIILQEEKDMTELELPQEGKNIAEKVSKIVRMLDNIRRIKWRLLQEDDKDKGEECGTISLTNFNELFKTSRQADSLFQDLSQMAQIFKQRIHSPAGVLDEGHSSISLWENQMIPAIKQLDSQVSQLHSLYSASLAKLSLNEKFEEAYKETISKDLQQGIISKLQQFIDKCEQLLPTQQTKPLPDVPAVQFAFGETQSQAGKQQPPSTQSPEVNARQRKQFLRRLDIQLMMGLARKQQSLL